MAQRPRRPLAARPHASRSPSPAPAPPRQCRRTAAGPGYHLERLVQVVADSGFVKDVLDVRGNVLEFAEEVILKTVELLHAIGTDVLHPGLEGWSVLLDALGDPAQRVHPLVLVEPQGAEALVVEDSPLLGIREPRQSQHRLDGVVQVFRVLTGVDPRAVQPSIVVVGEAPDPDAWWRWRGGGGRGQGEDGDGDAGEDPANAEGDATQGSPFGVSAAPMSVSPRPTSWSVRGAVSSAQFVSTPESSTTTSCFPTANSAARCRCGHGSATKVPRPSATDQRPRAGRLPVPLRPRWLA